MGFFSYIAHIEKKQITFETQQVFTLTRNQSFGSGIYISSYPDPFFSEGLDPDRKPRLNPEAVELFFNIFFLNGKFIKNSIQQFVSIT